MVTIIIIAIASTGLALCLRRFCLYKERLEVFEPIETEANEAYTHPCYEAPCSETCPESASMVERGACWSQKCRHWLKSEIYKNCKKGCIFDMKDCTGFTHGGYKNESCEIYKKLIKEKVCK